MDMIAAGANLQLIMFVSGPITELTVNPPVSAIEKVAVSFARCFDNPTFATP